MFPSSLAVVLAGLALGLLALVAFVLGWRRGHYSDLHAQARVIFDARDRRIDRPWETPQQRAARARDFGTLLPPEPGEWGEGEGSR